MAWDKKPINSSLRLDVRDAVFTDHMDRASNAALLPSHRLPGGILCPSPAAIGRLRQGFQRREFGPRIQPLEKGNDLEDCPE